MPFNLPFLPTMNNKRIKNYEDTISSIWGSIKNIYGQLNVELKHHDRTGTGALSYPAPGLTNDLMNISAGITGSGTGAAIDTGYRDGDKIRLKSFHMKGRLAGGTAQTEVNIIIFKHFDNFLGNTPTFEDIYENATNPSNYANQFRNLERKGQFRILARRQIRLSGLQDENNDKNFDIYIPFKTRRNSYVEWEGTLGTDPSNGKLYMFTWVTNNTGTPTISWASRTSYIDN